MPQPYPGQEWKHGWIPVTAAAARTKNHGKAPGAGSLLSRVVKEAAEAHQRQMRHDQEREEQQQRTRDASRSVDDAIRRSAGRTSQTRPAPGARPFHRDLAGVKDLADRVEQGPPRATRPLGGGMSAQTDLLTMPDGTKIVRKTSRDQDAERDAAAEQLTSLVATQLGLRAPQVYRNSRNTIFMEHIQDADPAQKLIGWGQERPRRITNAINSPDGQRVGLLDALTHGVDRNDGNWLLGNNGQVIPIDHGLSYTEIGPDSPPSLEYVTSPFADPYQGTGPIPLTRADVNEVRRRLETLRPDFAHVGRGDWLDYSLRMLDSLAPRARGTRNLIAGIR